MCNIGNEYLDTRKVIIMMPIYLEIVHKSVEKFIDGMREILGLEKEARSTGEDSLTDKVDEFK